MQSFFPLLGLIFITLKLLGQSNGWYSETVDFGVVVDGRYR